MIIVSTIMCKPWFVLEGTLSRALGAIAVKDMLLAAIYLTSVKGQKLKNGEAEQEMLSQRMGSKYMEKGSPLDILV